MRDTTGHAKKTKAEKEPFPSSAVGRMGSYQHSQWPLAILICFVDILQKQGGGKELLYVSVTQSRGETRAPKDSSVLQAKDSSFIY